MEIMCCLSEEAKLQRKVNDEIEKQLSRDRTEHSRWVSPAASIERRTIDEAVTIEEAFDGDDGDSNSEELKALDRNQLRNSFKAHSVGNFPPGRPSSYCWARRTSARRLL